MSELRMTPEERAAFFAEYLSEHGFPIPGDMDSEQVAEYEQALADAATAKAVRFSLVKLRSEAGRYRASGFLEVAEQLEYIANGLELTAHAEGVEVKDG